MRFAFVAKHRHIWPVSWLCDALDVSRSGFHAWLGRAPSRRSREDEEIGAKVRASFIASARTYGARRVWRDVLADGVDCGLHRVERLMQAQAFRARPRRRGLPKDEGQRLAVAAPNVLDRAFHAEAPNQKWIADFYATASEAGISKSTYQMDPANRREAIAESVEDEMQGADILMVKPALAYLDIIRDVRNATSTPLCIYNVSGEYAMLKAAGKAGVIDYERVMMETMIAFKRAGADIIISYHAKEVAEVLRRK